MASPNIGTVALHADGSIAQESDVAPAIHLSTTFRHLQSPDESQKELHPLVGDFVYSRDRAPTRTRLESILSSLIQGPTLTYSSGVAAVHAYLVCLKPRRVAIGDGYYGSRAVVQLYQELTACEILDFEHLDELQSGDVIHVETPTNPTGEAIDIRTFADKAHERGAYLVIDSTFAPPGLQNPFALGADVIMHSGTKYFGGHHDLLCGTLSVRPEREKDWFQRLHQQRTTLGSVLGSLEGWLGIRSLRTLDLRVQRQSENATKLVSWIDECLKSPDDSAAKSTVACVRHASLQTKDMHWLKEQMPNGFGAVFALEMKTEALAKCLPGFLTYFDHATSLGGVESQLEWRRLVDGSANPTLLRFSIGVESWEDLKADLQRGFQSLLKI